MIKKKQSRIRNNKKTFTTRQPHKQQQSVFITTNKIIVICSCLVVVIAVIFLNKRTITQSVAGVSIMRGMYAEATIPLPHIEEAASFNVYYKAVSDPTFIHAARTIPPDSTTYTISYLKKGISYQYKVAAVGPLGSEFWFSDVKPITNLQSM